MYPEQKSTYEKKDFSYTKKKIIPKETIITELYRPFFVFSTGELPEAIKEKAREAAQMLEKEAFTLRTDTVDPLTKEFEKYITRKEQYIPWQDFNQIHSKFHFNTQSSKNMAKLFSPKYDDFKKSIQAFLARNARAVLGQNVKSPILLAILWTADGAESIKERTAKSSFVSHPLAMCSAMKIPMFNLQNESTLTRLKEYLNHE